MSDNSPQNHDQPQVPCPDDRARAEAERQHELLSEEVAALRRRLADSPTRARDLENRCSSVQSSLATLSSQNERLVRTLKEAREQIVTLKARGRPARPAAVRPTASSSSRTTTATVDILTGGRKMRVAISPSRRPEDLAPGREVMLNEALNVVAGLRLRAGRRGRHGQGAARRRPGARGRPRRRGARLPHRRAASRASTIRVGDALMLDTARRASSTSVIPKAEVEELVLEEVPDIDYEDIGGLGGPDRADPRRRRAARTCTPSCSRSTSLQAAEGRAALRPARLRQDADRQGGRRIPGHARSRRKRAASRRASSFFLNIKGPELLNKYVGETERHIRLIFQRAREKASDGTPVVVFFDEMDSLFRTRGSGVSSDVETTIVPQLLVRDRRRRAARERHRHRRVQPRGHDRPGDPAARAGST